MTEEQLLKASKTAENVARKEIKLLFMCDEIETTHIKMRFLELYIDEFHSYIFKDAREILAN